VHQLCRVTLGLVVARRAHQMRRAHHEAIQPGDEQLTLRHQQHAAEIGLERHQAGRVHPTEAAAVDDRRRGRLAQGVQVLLGFSVYMVLLVSSENNTGLIITGVMHVFNGALTLAASVVLTLQIQRNIEVTDRFVTSS